MSGVGSIDAGHQYRSGFSAAAAKIGDVLARLNEIAEEMNNVNMTLKNNPVADRILGYETLYRKHSAGHYEFPFSAIVIPPAFTGGKQHWPRS
jgi:hypothetical protein